MKKRRVRRGYKVGTGAAPGESKEERDYRPEAYRGLLQEMMDPYWSFRFMRENGVSRNGG